MNRKRYVTWDESTLEQKIQAKDLHIIYAKVYSIIKSKDVTDELRKLINNDVLKFDTGEINNFTCGDISHGHQKHLYFEYTKTTDCNSIKNSSCANLHIHYNNVINTKLIHKFNKRISRIENDVIKHHLVDDSIFSRLNNLRHDIDKNNCIDKNIIERIEKLQGLVDSSIKFDINT